MKMAVVSDDDDDQSDPITCYPSQQTVSGAMITPICTRGLMLETLNPNLLRAHYAVRSEIATRASIIRDRLIQGDTSFPFESVISCNIGNPHALLSQKPITYIRQVLSLCMNPDLLSAEQYFPKDVMERARVLLSNMTGGMGAYTHSQGNVYIRSVIAAFLNERDGVETATKEIFCTKGASEAIKMTLTGLIRNDKDGVMIPIPQYPLYSATLDLLGGRGIGYYLDEPNQWSQSLSELGRSYRDATEEGVVVRALVLINPGNPTGQVLDRNSIEGCIQFCADNSLVLMADEVYADNVYDPNARFLSCRRVAHEMGVKLQTISYNSVSKGFTGECGLRGGYMHMWNLPEDVRQQFSKLASMSLCSNTMGQIAISLHLSPPQQGDPSYELYVSERDAILGSLKRRAMRMASALNNLQGVSCTMIQGAMYAFPKIQLPTKAVSAAEVLGCPPDELYVRELLEQTGVVCVPGSGFLQEDQTYHFRITILPPEDKIEEVITRVSSFHKRFMEKYR